MHPTARSSRSSLQSTILPPTTSSNLLYQQQQHVLYPIAPLQPCGTGPHPPCVYQGAQRAPTATNSSSLPVPGKGNGWQSKNKAHRGQQQYCQQQQQQLNYNPKPLVVYEQNPNGSLPASASSFLVASSTIAHGPLPGDHYNASGVTLFPQPYYKPPEVQTFCLIQDRGQGAQQFQQQPLQGSYYNIAATNSCNVQAVNPNSTIQLANFAPYASLSTLNQVAGPGQAPQILSNSPIGLVLNGTAREKFTPSSTMDSPSLKNSRNKLTDRISQETSTDWPVCAIEPSAGNLFASRATNNGHVDCLENSGRKGKSREDRFSDESSTSFDFTIEAEKMVSALCNTTSSNDLAKEECQVGKNERTNVFNGAGDNTTNKTSWFSDFCSDCDNARTVATQTEVPCTDRAQYQESLRKIIYWACTEAELILNSQESQGDAKFSWLSNLSSATRTAITKSSTCFPVFAGDRIFAGDMINSLIRISNGWLILDNYLNKQHYPSLGDKLDRNLIRSFHAWEENTYDLIRRIVETFRKLEHEANSSVNSQKSLDLASVSFPGDVSLYTSCDLFDPSNDSKDLGSQSSNCKGKPLDSILRGERYGVSQSPALGASGFQYFNAEDERSSCQRETKLRSKWTITENLSATIDSAKSVPAGSVGQSDVGLRASSRFRSRINNSTSSSGKYGQSKQSLNAEFYRLRSKVMNSGNESNVLWSSKDKELDFFDNRISQPAGRSTDLVPRTQKPISTGSCGNIYPQRCLTMTDSNFENQMKRDYFGSVCGNAINTAIECSYGENGADDEGNYVLKSPIEAAFVGQSSNEQIKLPAVPRNRMTLLSQIEPSTSSDKDSVEMTANLTAWFASMRSASGSQFVPASLTASTDTRRNETKNNRAAMHHPQNLTRNAMDLTRQLQIDANRQLQTLQNMQSIQSAPWNVYNLLNNQSQVQPVVDEYDSSEDVRVYMKPGSYNVPKKRHQRKPNRKYENYSNSSRVAGSQKNFYENKEKSSYILSSVSNSPCGNIAPLCTSISSTTTATIKIPFPASPIVPPPIFSLGNSPRILKRAETSTREIQHKDVAWKAACASAEILLEALNVRENGGSMKNKKNGDKMETETGRKDTDEREIENIVTLERIHRQKATTLRRRSSKSTKFDETNCLDASSYEASEDDSGSTCKLSPGGSLPEVLQSREGRSTRVNVKTDSWLIRTFNNASIAGKQKIRKDNDDYGSSESSMSGSFFDDDRPIEPTTFATISAIAEVTAEGEKQEQTKNSAIENSVPPEEEVRSVVKEKEGSVGRATYSETVRRSVSGAKKDFTRKVKADNTGPTICSTVLPIPARKCSKRELEKSYNASHKSRKFSGKKKSGDEVDDRSSSKNGQSTGESFKCSPSIVTFSLAKSSASGKPINAKKKEIFGNRGEPMENKNSNKIGDRGWSVWYSLRRRQSLSPLALNKLETIHQTVWQMDEARIFKYPQASSTVDKNSEHASACGTMEDYCKVVKSPMFLETVGYKLKNRIYHKVEHAIRDFRRIVYNSRLYHKNDGNTVKRIEALSERLEELFQEHFASWDLDNITGSPRDGNGSPTSNRLKSSGQKSAKKCSSFSVNAETSPPH